MAAPTVRSVGTVAAVASGNLTPGLPAGTVAGDLLVACFVSKDNIDITGAGGWVSFGAPLPSRPAGTRNLEVLWKQAGASESATTFTHTGGNSTIGRVIAITAGTWDTADVLGGIAVSTTSLVIPSVTPEVVDCLMLAVMAAADDDGAGASNFAAYSAGGLTWTERIDNATTLGTDSSLGAATAPNPGNSATGAGTYTSTSAGVTHCALIAIRPAPPAGTAVDLTPATETDTAQAVTAAKHVTLTPATETDTSVSVPAIKTVTITLATETDTPVALSVAKRVTLVPVTETDTAQELFYQLVDGSVTLTPAEETDQAQSVSVAKRATLVPAEETTAPPSLELSKRATVTPAGESAVPVAVSVAKRVTLAPAAVTDTAVPLTTVKRVLLSPGLTSDAAVSLALTTRVSLTPASELDTAGAIARAGELRPVGLDEPRTATFVTVGSTAATFETSTRAASLEKPGTKATFERPHASAMFEQAETEVVLA